MKRKTKDKRIHSAEQNEEDKKDDSDVMILVRELQEKVDIQEQKIEELLNANKEFKTA